VYGTYTSPVAEVLAISHRANPIYHALLPFTSEEGKLISVSWEPQITRTLQSVFPWVTNSHLDKDDYSSLIIQVAKPSENAARDLLDHILTHFTRVKTAVVVDQDIDVHNRREVAFALGTRMQPDKDVLIKSNLRAYALDPSATATNEEFCGSKIGFDATMPLMRNEKYAKTRMPDEVDRKIEKLLRRYL
jgi:2,5-furandicarboxylate decarboxylase 1